MRVVLFLTDAVYLFRINLEISTVGTMDCKGLYCGPKTCCDNCQKAFTHGAVITVVTDPVLAFCYSDAMGRCLQEYMFFHTQDPRMLIGNPYQYHMPTTEADSSIQKLSPSLWARLLSFFRINRSQRVVFVFFAIIIQ